MKSNVFEGRYENFFPVHIYLLFSRLYKFCGLLNSKPRPPPTPTPLCIWLRALAWEKDWERKRSRHRERKRGKREVVHDKEKCDQMKLKGNEGKERKVKWIIGASRGKTLIEQEVTLDKQTQEMCCQMKLREWERVTEKKERGSYWERKRRERDRERFI